MKKCIFCQNEGFDYPAIIKDRSMAAGYFNINYCPVCGRKLDTRADDISREVLSELTGLSAESSIDRLTAELIFSKGYTHG